MQNISGHNWLGVYTLYMREVRRFIKVYTQTIIGPIVTTLLFLAIFALSIGSAIKVVGDVAFIQFLLPGLIMMAIVQNAFANTSSSIMISKVQGNIVDTLMPPFNAHELTFALAMGGVTRGVMVGFVVAVVTSFFVPFQIFDFFYVAYYAVAASLMLSLLGLLGGVWSEKFDHIAGLTNFVVTPLSFLSGTFYSIHRLPEFFQMAAHFNPFFYMIDGFRYGFIGYSDASLTTGMVVVALMDLALWIACWAMFKTGYRLKS
ncbi:MAG: ABC transporter permease [Rhodospirillaceae bacterium]|nr:ABC transporter permease [Rhodospirillaceae bacterium]